MVPHAENWQVVTLHPSLSKTRMHSGFLREAKFQIDIIPSAPAVAKICQNVWESSGDNKEEAGNHNEHQECFSSMRERMAICGWCLSSQSNAADTHIAIRQICF
jgi:hypothetical protein